MPDDIVTRLACSPWLAGSPTGDLINDARVEIERLRTELASEQRCVQYLNDRLAYFEQAPHDCS